MIQFSIKFTLDNSQIQGLYQLYIFQLDSLRQPTKEGFIRYMKNQVAVNGCDEFLLSANDYPELTPNDLETLMKWRLI